MENNRKANSQTKMLTYQDVIQFQNPNYQSSFGKIMLSNQKSAPKYGFGTAERQQQQKVYQGEEMAKTQFIGKNSPGPSYNLRGSDEYVFKRDPTVKIGTQIRKGLESGQYDYFLRKDVSFEPHEADNLRRTTNPRVRFGVEPRFARSRSMKGPGPSYEPQIDYIKQRAPKYTLGSRRPNSVQDKQGSTTAIVGPGAYLQTSHANTSIIQNEPKYSFPKQSRTSTYQNTWDINQTYDTKQKSMGVQVNSRKKTGAVCTFGKSHRDVSLGYFKNLMVKQPASIRMSLKQF